MQWEKKLLPDPYVTPATGYTAPGRTVQRGTARIVQSEQPARRYYAVGVHDAIFLSVGAHKVTLLQELDCRCYTDPKIHTDMCWKDWMTDDPTHWEHIQQYAHRLGLRGCKYILVGGLGLGLILHAFARRMPWVHLTVIERNKDIIELMRERIPSNAIVIHDDFWNAIGRSWPLADGVFVDLWRGPLEDNVSDVIARARLVEARFPWPNVESLFLFYQPMIDAMRHEARREATRIL